MAQWAETCRRIFNIDYQYMFDYWLNKLLYYCKTQQDGSYKKTRVQYLINFLKMESYRTINRFLKKARHSFLPETSTTASPSPPRLLSDGYLKVWSFPQGKAVQAWAYYGLLTTADIKNEGSRNSTPSYTLSYVYGQISLHCYQPTFLFPELQKDLNKIYSY
jgi:hypothetical protein